MKKTISLANLALLGLALTACTTTGVGDGQFTDGGAAQEPVAFSWTSTDGGLSGTMTATLPDTSYQGGFFQITQQTRSEVLTPLWNNWNRGWNDWPYWGGPMRMQSVPTTQFMTHYSGKVVANLTGQGGQYMRCRFHLIVPSRGMSGGGEGQCQFADSRVVQAVFPGR